MLHALLLDTLPGWPHADDPSFLTILLLLVGLPLAVAALMTVAGMGKRWRGGHDDDAYAPDVRRSMALAGADSSWSDDEAGNENDDAAPLTGRRPRVGEPDRVLAGASAAAAPVPAGQHAHNLPAGYNADAEHHAAEYREDASMRDNLGDDPRHGSADERDDVEDVAPRRAAR